jgi:hypothetical protein
LGFLGSLVGLGWERWLAGPKLLFSSLVGYTMNDIRYKWDKGIASVGVSSDVSLPQFKVLGHRQQAMEISLTTGYTSQTVSLTGLGFYVLSVLHLPPLWKINTSSLHLPLLLLCVFDLTLSFI